MQITQSHSVDTASAQDALRYCGKQLCRALVFETYFYMLLFSLGMFLFIYDANYPEKAAESMAEIRAEMRAAEEAHRAKRLEAERKAGLLGAQHANHTK